MGPGPLGLSHLLENVCTLYRQCPMEGGCVHTFFSNSLLTNT